MLLCPGRHFSVTRQAACHIDRILSSSSQGVVQAWRNIVFRTLRISFKRNSSFFHRFHNEFFFVLNYDVSHDKMREERAQQQGKHTHSYIGLKDKMIYTGELNISNSKTQTQEQLNWGLWDSYLTLWHPRYFVPTTIWMKGSECATETVEAPVLSGNVNIWGKWSIKKNIGLSVCGVYLA